MSAEAGKPKFLVGELVMLKSGGPLMTVEKAADPESLIEPHNKAECIWFTSSGALRSEYFPEDALRKSIGNEGKRP